MEYAIEIITLATVAAHWFAASWKDRHIDKSEWSELIGLVSDAVIDKLQDKGVSNDD